MQSEGGMERLIRKVQEDPLVPLGAAATCAFLGMGIYSFKKGDAGRSQTMMRGRIAAQAFTLVALCYGVYLRDEDGPAKGREKVLEKFQQVNSAPNRWLRQSEKESKKVEPQP